MNKTVIGIASFQFFVFILSASPVWGQLNLRADAETGVYASMGSVILDKYDYFNSIEGQIGYTYKNESRNGNIKLRFRPEFYGTKNQLRTLKIRADGSYYQNEHMFNWGIRVNRQVYKFTGRNLNLNYNSFNLDLNSDWFFIKNFPINLTASYGYQKIIYQNNQILNLFAAALSTVKSISEFSNISPGFYAERFNVSGSNTVRGINNPANNYGWRYGPQIIFNFVKNMIVNIQYRFLIHNSDLTGSFSYEQMIRLVAGKLLTDKLSAFLLTDIYLRKFRLSRPADGNFYLLYNSMNVDNRIYLKIGYDLSDMLELYVRTGYLKENLIDENYSYSGWNAIFGIEIAGSY